MEFSVDELSARVVGRYGEGREGHLAADAGLEGALGEVVPVELRDGVVSWRYCPEVACTVSRTSGLLSSRWLGSGR